MELEVKVTSTTLLYLDLGFKLHRVIGSPQIQNEKKNLSKFFGTSSKHKLLKFYKFV